MKDQVLPFSFDETKLLLKVWGMPENQDEFLKHKRHSKIWALISLTMQDFSLGDNGVPMYPVRTGKQVQNRLNNKKQDYNKIKSRIKSGASSDIAKEFPYFDDFEKVLGTKPSVTGAFASDSMEEAVIQDEVFINSEDEDTRENSTTKEPPAKKSKKSKSDNAEWQEKLVECQQKSLDLSSKKYDDERNLTTAMTKFFEAGVKYYEKKTELLSENGNVLHLV